MIFKITYSQIRFFTIITVLFVITWLLMGHTVRQGPVNTGPHHTLAVELSFLAPMNSNTAMQHFTIKSQLPGKPVKYKSQWISRNTIRITIDESEYPRGLEYTYYFRKAPALIPPFTVSAGGRFCSRVKPALVSVEPGENAPTRGPVTLTFNTPIEPGSFNRCVAINCPGAYRPVQVEHGGRRYKDYSRWEFIPAARMKNSYRYHITVQKGLMSGGGGQLDNPVELFFTTAPALETLDIYPRPGSPSVWLSRQIKFVTNLPVKEAGVKVTDTKGNVVINGNTVTFEPEEILLPAKRYHVLARLISIHGEEVNRDFYFNTTNLGNQRWLDVKTGNPCKIMVIEGNKEKYRFEGWLSLSAEKIPRVTMYEDKRGSSLELNPHQKNPVRYIKLNADIMLHPLPGGIGDNHDLLGLPRSYGCIYLNKADFDWIFSNLQNKFMAVVH